MTLGEKKKKSKISPEQGERLWDRLPPSPPSPFARRGLGRVKLLEIFRNKGRVGAPSTPPTLTHAPPPPTHPPTPPHPPANGYEPRKVPQSFILAGERWLPSAGKRNREGLGRGGWGGGWTAAGREGAEAPWGFLPPWEKFPAGAKTYPRRWPMAPRRQITAAHSAANGRGRAGARHNGSAPPHPHPPTPPPPKGQASPCL